MALQLTANNDKAMTHRRGMCVQVRRKLVGKTQPSYSQYTCYTGIADFMPPDIDTVGYRVFLGNGKYFVSSDVGGGKMQWCGPPCHLGLTRPAILHETTAFFLCGHAAVRFLVLLLPFWMPAILP